MEHALDVVADDRAERQIGAHVRALAAEHDRRAVRIAVHDQSVAEEIGTVHAAVVDVGRQRDGVPRAMGQPRRNRAVHRIPLLLFAGFTLAAANPQVARRDCRRDRVPRILPTRARRLLL